MLPSFVQLIHNLSSIKNIAYHDIQVSFNEGTNGLNIALLNVESVEHCLLGRVMRLNGPA